MGDFGYPVPDEEPITPPDLRERMAKLRQTSLDTRLPRAVRRDALNQWLMMQ